MDFLDGEKLFPFSRDEISRCLSRDILLRGRTVAWNSMFAPKRHKTKKTIIAEHDGGFQENATLLSHGNVHVLCITGEFDDTEKPHVILSAAFYQDKRQTLVGFEMEGIGFHPPREHHQAEKVLREIGNILRNIPKELHYDKTCRELHGWADLHPIYNAGETLPPLMAAKIQPDRFTPKLTPPKKEYP